jgi:multiple sugar transport system ATP-binding protein
MTSLRLHEIRKTYGKVVALDSMDFEVEAGQFYVLFGPSAVGKTTTLRVIAGLERPDSGRLEIDGRDFTDAPIAGRGLSMVFQSFALYPHMTIYDNLAYPLRESGMRRKEIDAKVHETAEMLRLTHTLKRKPATASGGEQQRVAIGRALIQRPNLLLLDEPLTNLDAKLRHDMRAEIKRLHREFGLTIVYATPDELEALSMGERIAVMREGRVVQVGTPDGLYTGPGDTYVATKIGSPPMNLIKIAQQSDLANSVKLPFGELTGAPWQNALREAGFSGSYVVGIRPNDVVPTSPDNGYEAVVHMTEPLGDVTILDLRAGGETVRMVLPEAQASSIRSGDKLHFTFDPSRTHLFNGESGGAIEYSLAT